MTEFEDNLKRRMQAAEDRWKDTEEAPEEDKPETFSMEDLPEEFQNCIQHPFADEFVPMVMVAVEGINYIGGMIEVTDDGRISTLFPMLYFERIENGSTGGARLQIGMVKLYNALRMMAKYDIRYTGLYIMDRRSPQDLELVNSYNNAVTKAIAGDAGIEAPTSNLIV